MESGLTFFRANSAPNVLSPIALESAQQRLCATCLCSVTAFASTLQSQAELRVAACVCGSGSSAYPRCLS